VIVPEVQIFRIKSQESRFKIDKEAISKEVAFLFCLYFVFLIYEDLFVISKWGSGKNDC